MIHGSFALSALMVVGCSPPSRARAGGEPAPNLSITAPPEGATVEGLIAVSAIAPNLSARGRVRFRFPDGFSIDDSIAPYTARWDSEHVGDGALEIRVEAIDGDATAAARLRVITSNGNTCRHGASWPLDTPIAIPDHEGARTLTIRDLGIGDIGTLRSWSIVGDCTPGADRI